MHNPLKTIINLLRKRSRVVAIFTMVLLLGVTLVASGILFWNQYTSNPFDPFRVSQAAFTPYSEGQVSIDQAFVVGSTEYQTVTTTPSSTIKIRLKYNNTGNTSADNARISSQLPNGFNYVPGTLRNVYKDSFTSSLNDNLLFTGNGLLTVSPTAGFYGFSNSSTIGLLDMGRKAFLRVPRCSPLAEIFSQTANNQVYTSYDPTTNICSSITGGGFEIAYDIQLDTQRYLKIVNCSRPTRPNEVFAQYSSNTLSSSSLDSTGTTCAQTVDGSFVSVSDLDILAGRYLRMQQCTRPTSPVEIFEQAITLTPLESNDSSGNTCFSTLGEGSFQSGFNIDLFDGTRGYGYIEFEATAPNTPGCYTLPVSLESDDFSLFTETGGTCDIKVQSQTSFGGGNINYEKVYWNGASEINFVDTAPSGQYTVRLKYDSTGNQVGSNARITDTFDTSNYTYVNGSASNCLLDVNHCVTLNDNSFSSGVITLSPSSGWYGSQVSSTSGNLEIGRSRYITVIHCSNGQYTDYFTATAGNTSSGITGSCSDYGLTGYTKSGYHTVDILGKAYLNTIICEKDGYTNTFVAQSTNSTGAASNGCSDFGLIDYSKIGGYEIGLSNSLYINNARCEKNSIPDIAELQTSRNSGQASNTCASRGLTDYTANGGDSVSIEDSGQASGFIQFTLEANSNARLGLYGTNSTLSSTSSAFSSVTTYNLQTVRVKLYCDSINPTGGFRSVALSDAELRTDQDFTCNFEARICPVVFNDADLNGAKSESETVYTGLTIELRRASNNSLVATTTTSSSSQVCFQSLASGETYTVSVVSPPASFSSTGGDSVTLESSVLEENQYAYFGYATGGLVLNASDQIFFPSISTANSDIEVNASIPAVSVIDLRPNSSSWAVSATWSDFVPTSGIAVLDLPVNNRLTSTPQNLTTTSGSSQKITLGQVKTTTSPTDITDIFGTGANDGDGNYQVAVGVDYLVPAYSAAVPYRGEVVFTII